MVRKPEMQLGHMEQANVRPGYSARRPMESLELEMEDGRDSRPDNRKHAKG